MGAIETKEIILTNGYSLWKLAIADERSRTG
jgi:hypothetical protein